MSGLRALLWGAPLALAALAPDGHAQVAEFSAGKIKIVAP